MANKINKGLFLTINNFKSDRIITKLLMIPAMAVILVLIIYPLIFSLTRSFTNFNLGIPNISFIGFDNYVQAIKDPHFINSLTVTLKFSFGTTLIGLILGFLSAFLLKRKFFGKRIITLLLIVPMMTTPVVVGIIWMLMFQPGFGVVNGLLSLIGLDGPKWFLESNAALIAVTIADIWQWTPFYTLIILAGLLSVPQGIIEAAKVDGASNWQMFWRIIIPMIKNLVIIAVLIRLIDSFKVFDSIFIMTNGGPGRATEVLSMFIYRTGLPYLNMGYSLAMSYLFLIILSIIGFILLRYLTKSKSAT